MRKGSDVRIRVLITKLGLDGHERGALVVALGLRDEGMEVIYIGIRQSADSIVNTAIAEDVDVVGLSCLSGAYELMPEIVSKLKEAGMDDVLVIGGGVIPDEDVPYLKKKGISAIFGPGTPVPDIAAYIREHIRNKT